MGMEIAQEAHPFRCPPVCSFCDSKVFSNSGVDEWSVIVCTSCLSAGIHVRCYNKLHGGNSGTELAASDEHYFCSKECQEVHTRLSKLSPSRISSLDDPEAQFHIFKGGKGAKPLMRNARLLLSTIFELQHEVNGKTAIEMMCNGFKSSASKENPESRFDFSEYFVAVLKVKFKAVSAAIFRVYGPKFACIAYLGTDPKYRMTGKATMLSKTLRIILRSIGVQYLIAPAVHSSKAFWTSKLGFREASMCEAKEIKEWNLPNNDSSTTLLLTELSRTSEKESTPEMLPISLGKTPVDNTEVISRPSGALAHKSTTKKRRRVGEVSDHAISYQEGGGCLQNPECSWCNWPRDEASLLSEPFCRNVSVKCTECAADDILLRFCGDILHRRQAQFSCESKSRKHGEDLQGSSTTFEDADCFKRSKGGTKCFLCGITKSAKWLRDPLSIEVLCQSCHPKLVQSLGDKCSLMMGAFLDLKRNTTFIPLHQQNKVSDEKPVDKGRVEKYLSEIKRLRRENALLRDELLDCLRAHYRNQNLGARTPANKLFCRLWDEGVNREGFVNGNDAHQKVSSHHGSDCSDPLNDQISELCYAEKGPSSNK